MPWAQRHCLIRAGCVAQVDVSITMVVLGSIDTEAVSDVKGLIKGVQWAPPDEAARAIIRGGALKRRDVFYPFSQVRRLPPFSFMLNQVVYSKSSSVAY